MLCIDDMVPDAAREMELHGANILVSLINASAFESKFTLFQHRLLSQLRSIECRRFFLRCSATGETCVISPFGDITNRIKTQENGYLIADVKLIDSTTVYSRFPLLLPLLVIGISILWVSLYRKPPSYA